MKGYKAFNKDLKCRDFQFVVGNTYKIKGELKIYSNGFHFCKELKDVYQYYPRNYNTRVCEVEAIGEVVSEDVKSCTSKIRITRELSKEEINTLTGDLSFNSGYYNTGYYNSGDCNSGNYNTGNSNTGHYNSGYSNTGNYNTGNSNTGHSNTGNSNTGHSNTGNSNTGHSNTGYYNSGDCNSGNYNTGNSNTGYYNSGDCNSGYYNSGDYNSGFFNTDEPTVRMFNRDSNLKFNDPIINKLKLLRMKPLLRWITTNNMSEEEKKNYPSYKTTGGYLKHISELIISKEGKELILSLPGYDDDIFKKIFGISLLNKGE